MEYLHLMRRDFFFFFSDWHICLFFFFFLITQLSRMQGCLPAGWVQAQSEIVAEFLLFGCGFDTSVIESLYFHYL